MLQIDSLSLSECCKYLGVFVLSLERASAEFMEGMQFYPLTFLKVLLYMAF